ncbi:DUF5683 domain-containing protein [Capnocytophaga sp. ARDL2]|uniref:DUF5683 domain-containing protein n=1 Tax=Capnocytophaga sp. ARDL2 TaxID=3238809 RepID=UPI0035570EF6
MNTIEKEYSDLGFDHQAPSKAAFYSAVVPGLGQIYNKSYWKLPIAYGGLGFSTYLYFNNHRNYNRWRNEYKRRLQGIHDTTDPYFGRLDNDRLIRGQRIYQRNRDLALVVTIGIYALNILDANIDAHLKQFDISEDLSLYPAMEYNHLNDSYQFGVVLNFRF